MTQSEPDKAAVNAVKLGTLKSAASMFLSSATLSVQAMYVAPSSCAAQDAAAITRWSAEACSSKDTASRMNSPRNSKSSGTPHVSPEQKSYLCVGAEFDMEEDVSSQSGKHHLT